MADTAKITEKFRVFNSKQFVESFDETSSTNHYFFIGRSADWETLVEYYSEGPAAPQVGDTVSFETLASYPAQTHATITKVVEGGFLCSGLDPAAITSLAFALDFTYPAGGANTGKILKIRPANEDEVLRPTDNQEEKYDYYKEIIAAKRIFNETLGQNTGTSPDQSFLSPVVARIDYGIDSNGLPGRTEPYDMWHPGLAATNNFTRVQPGPGQTLAEQATEIADLEMITRTGDYQVWMCIDNNYDAATETGAAPDNFSGPNYLTLAGGTGTDADQAGFCTLNGVYTTANGYRWKLLYKMDIESVVRFQSQRFIPFLPFDVAGAGGETEAAVEIAGPEVGNVLEKGSGWGAGPVSYYAPINGDGQAVDGSTLKVMKIDILGGEIVKARAMVVGETGYSPTWADAEYTYGKVSLEVGDPAQPDGYKTGLFDDPLLTDVTNATTAVAGATGGYVEVVIPPQGGYGSAGAKGTAGYAQFVEQLNVKRVMANIRLTFDEGSGDFPVTNDFRRIGLLRDPKGYNGAGGIDITNANSSDYETARNTYAMVFNGNVGGIGGVDYTANFNVDEEITQTITLADTVTTREAKGTVVEWTPTSDTDPTLGGVLRYYQDPSVHADNGKVHQFIDAETVTANPAIYSSAGDIQGSETLNHNTPPTATVSRYAWSATIGAGEAGGAQNTPLEGAAATALYPELEPYTGEFLYVENRRLITRAIDQIEDIKLVIEF